MIEEYQDFEINIDDIIFPKTIIKADVKISPIKNQLDMKTVFRMHQDIFPDEIDSNKNEQIENAVFTGLDCSFIAKIEENIVGFIVTSPLDKKNILLAYLGVLKEFRGTGVATKLLKTLISYSQLNNYEKICCTIHHKNKKTLNYVKVLGFKKLIKNKK